MEPQASAGWRRLLSGSVAVLQRKLRLGDAFGASGDDPPLRHGGWGNRIQCRDTLV